MWLKLYKYLFALCFILVFTSCSKEAEPIEFGKDKCANCSMTISENKWGAELITAKGKIYKFDAIECMAYFSINKAVQQKIEIGSLWTINYLNPGELINIEKAHLLKSDAFNSPMGMNIASFKSISDLNQFKKNDKDIEFNWNNLLVKVESEW